MAPEVENCTLTPYGTCALSGLLEAVLKPRKAGSLARVVAAVFVCAASLAGRALHNSRESRSIFWNRVFEKLQSKGDRQLDNKPAQNIQDSFLNTARKDKTSLTIYLLSGVKLTGRIRSFDKYSVVLETGNQEQLIFKHAISTVVMAKAAHGEARELRVAESRLLAGEAKPAQSSSAHTVTTANSSGTEG